MGKKAEPIRMNELMAELDRLRRRPASKVTPEVDKIIIAARTGKNVVPFRRLSSFLERKGFGTFSRVSLQERWIKLKNTEQVRL